MIPIEVMPTKERKVTVDEIRRHGSTDDCWIVVDGNVWDLTEFAPEHPGGAGSQRLPSFTDGCEVITKHAGRDASDSYNAIHSPSILSENLVPSKRIGVLDTSTLPDDWLKPPPEKTPEVKLSEKPPLHTLINLHDFETVAAANLTPKTYAFYSSAATDCRTRDLNNELFARILLRPRILRNVVAVNTSSSLLSRASKFPFFVSPAALAKLAHPDGEKALARGCAEKGIVECLSTNASYPIPEIMDSTPPDQPFWFQLYVNKDRAKTEALLKSLLALRPRRIAGVVVTVDAPVPGKREADERLKADESITSPNSGASAKNDAKGGGLGRIMGQYIDPGLCWEDLAWLRSIIGPDMPLLLKGVQSAADAKLAMEAGLQGIIVSNHGGRSLDTSPPSVLILLELRLRCPEVFDAMEVYIDGGVRRGTDIFKCLALGAKAVGIGRHFLYSLCYGQEGVEHLIEILRDELETTMRLVGVTELKDIGMQYLNIRDVEHLVPGFTETRAEREKDMSNWASRIRRWARL